MTLQPLVRIILTFLVAALSALVGLVDDETVRVICLPLIAGLAAVGIVPPQVPTRTVVAESADVVKVRSERGYGLVELLVALAVFIIVCLLLLKLIAAL